MKVASFGGAGQLKTNGRDKGHQRRINEAPNANADRLLVVTGLTFHCFRWKNETGDI